MLLSTTLETLIFQAIDRAYAAGKQANATDDAWNSALPWYLELNRGNSMPDLEKQKIIKEIFHDHKEK